MANDQPQSIEHSTGNNDRMKPIQEWREAWFYANEKQLQWLTYGEFLALGVRGQNALREHEIKSFKQLCDLGSKHFKGRNVGKATMWRLKQLIHSRGFTDDDDGIIKEPLRK